MKHIQENTTLITLEKDVATNEKYILRKMSLKFQFTKSNHLCNQFMQNSMFYINFLLQSVNPL